MSMTPIVIEYRYRGDVVTTETPTGGGTGLPREDEYVTFDQTVDRSPEHRHDPDIWRVDHVIHRVHDHRRVVEVSVMPLLKTELANSDEMLGGETDVPR